MIFATRVTLLLLYLAKGMQRKINIKFVIRNSFLMVVAYSTSMKSLFLFFHLCWDVEKKKLSPQSLQTEKCFANWTNILHWNMLKKYILIPANCQIYVWEVQWWEKGSQHVSIDLSKITFVFWKESRCCL